MKTLIFILMIVSFFQTTILSVDLVLIILICRAYLRADRSNLYLAFAFGLLISQLNLTLFGSQSIIYLVIIQLTQILGKSRLAGNPAVVVPLAFIFQFLSQSPNILIGTILSLPVFYLIRLWEERFIVPQGIKLRV